MNTFILLLFLLHHNVSHVGKSVYRVITVLPLHGALEPQI